MSVEQGQALSEGRMCDWPKEVLRESKSEGEGEGRGSVHLQKRGSSEAWKTKANSTTIRTSLVPEATICREQSSWIVAGRTSRVAGRTCASAVQASERRARNTDMARREGSVRT